ncbi:MAG TPA: inositol monophosphatase family protein [Thermoleophilia bacterium]|nr:inositol monophosphatase family protein [Thermoleophilia bacterium]
MASASAPEPDFERAWLDCARAMSAAAAEVVMALVGTAAGRAIVGTGKGGDQTVELDRVAEEAMLRILEERAPERYRVVSEEIGAVGPEDAPRLVLVDPVDGSLNAKRGLPTFSTVVAVAAGPSMDDVFVGYIEDLPTRAWYAAGRAEGFTMSRLVEPASVGQQIELILLEASQPERHEFSLADVARLVDEPARAGVRVRSLGSLALAISQVASGVADLLLAPVPSRAVDIAAGLHMVRRSGGGAAALDGTELWEQPLDLERRAPFIAWRAGLDGDRLLRRARRLLG